VARTVRLKFTEEEYEVLARGCIRANTSVPDYCRGVLLGADEGPEDRLERSAAAIRAMDAKRGSFSETLALEEDAAGGE
jgi:hypothetical protein